MPIIEQTRDKVKDIALVSAAYGIFLLLIINL